MPAVASTEAMVRGASFGGSIERLKKYYSHSWKKRRAAVFLGFGFVLAQSQGVSNLLLRQSLAKTQKSSLRTAILFLKTL
jgi:hypothetical protein